MKRLTERVKKCADLKEIYGGWWAKDPDYIREANRFADYADTGLEPAQCENAKIIIESPFGNDTSKTERIRELLKADKEGRIAVLPCKDWLDIVFGEQTLFWGIDTNYIESPIREITVDDADRIGWYDGYKTVFLKGTDENGEAWEFYPEEIGKTIFLTREEAEAALEAMEDGN